MIPEQIIEQIGCHGNAVLYTHSHPDGDALGSLLGLASILESLGKKVFCFVEEPVSHFYSFLPDVDKAQTSLDAYRSFVSRAHGDLVSIALDCGDEDRLGVYKDEFLTQSPFLAIDHHRSHCDFGTDRWVDEKKSSTGEMVYELGLVLGAKVNYNCALNLYVAICTDTGSFRYECTGPRTMQIAGELMALGVRSEDVAAKLYDSSSLERLRLLGMVLETITLCDNDRIAFMHVPQQLLLKSGASMEDVEGFVDFARSLKTVKVAAVLKESDGGSIAVSLRAKGECNVSEVAKKFNGGGHRNAAGFRRPGGSLEQLRAELEQVLKEALQNDSSTQ
jgi:phosphoesterase RecJ-like protein